MGKHAGTYMHSKKAEDAIRLYVSHHTQYDDSRFYDNKIILTTVTSLLIVSQFFGESKITNFDLAVL